MEPIATVFLPGALLTALFLLPFLDRNPSRRLRSRPVAVTCGSIVLASTAALSLYSVIRERPQPGSPGAAVPSGINIELASAGKRVYDAQNCASCHAIGGQGGSGGPDLTQVGIRRQDRTWQVRHLIDPKSKIPGSPMPAFEHLKPDELKALAEYLVSLR